MNSRKNLSKKPTNLKYWPVKKWRKFQTETLHLFNNLSTTKKVWSIKFRWKMRIGKFSNRTSVVHKQNWMISWKKMNLFLNWRSLKFWKKKLNNWSTKWTNSINKNSEGECDKRIHRLTFPNRGRPINQDLLLNWIL